MAYNLGRTHLSTSRPNMTRRSSGHRGLFLQPPSEVPVISPVSTTQPTARQWVLYGIQPYLMALTTRAFILKSDYIEGVSPVGASIMARPVEPGEWSTDTFVLSIVQQDRTKLLDLTSRNPLISFKHSERSRSHIRVIEEIPEKLFNKLCPFGKPACRWLGPIASGRYRVVRLFSLLLMGVWEVQKHQCFVTLLPGCTSGEISGARGD